jgi:hypothetical protein
MTSTAIAAIKTKAAERTTDQLMAALHHLEGQGQLGAEHRMVKACMSDVVEERHQLTEAMDALYGTDYAGTYTEALTLCLAAQAVDLPVVNLAGHPLRACACGNTCYLPADATDCPACR